MGWQTTGDVAEFLAAAGAFLRAERARNTVFLTVTETIRVNPAQYRGGDDTDPARLPLFGWWTVAGGVGGAFMHTPNFPVLLTALPAAVAADLAEQTLAGRPLPGVNAYPEAAEAFGAAWREQTGGRVAVHRKMRLYRLAGLCWPRPMPDGVPRTAGEGDVALLTDWLTAFGREVNDTEHGDLAASIRERFSYGGLTMWEADGRPVSVAGLTRRAAGMVRVGPVYTPPELRGHGYASAATAEVSRKALAAGAEEVLLYTDLANPVSNAIYQRIGYQEIEDRVVLSFSQRLPPAGDLAGPGWACRHLKALCYLPENLRFCSVSHPNASAVGKHDRMGWYMTSDLDRFLAAAGDYLKSRAAENALLLSAAQTAQTAQPALDAHDGPAAVHVATGPGPLFGWWDPPDGSGPRGAFLHDPSVPLLIAGRAPETAAALAAALAKAGRSVSGVDGPVSAADAFAAAWSQRAGLAIRVHEHGRVYRLTQTPSAQTGPAGRFRIAAAADRALLVTWLRAFGTEVGELTGSPEVTADDLLGYGGAAFWEAAGHPVAMAAVTRPVARTVRISMLYTPPEHRHNGYAAAVMLAVSRAALDGQMREVVLITDENRPQRLAARLGYELIGERAVLRFGPPTGPQPRLATGPQPRLRG